MVNLENQAPLDLLEIEVLKDPLAHQDQPAKMEMMDSLDLLEFQAPQEQMDAMELMDVMDRMGKEGQQDPEDYQVPQDLTQGVKEG